MTNVLFLVMEFPPVSTTGNYRTLKFVKYLQEFGVNPVVLTLSEESGAKIFHSNINEKLLKEIPESVKVIRIPANNTDKYYSNKLRSFISIYFSVRDIIAEVWKPNLDKQIEQIIRKNNIQAIFTSLPPFSCGSLAADYAKKFKLPLIVDMRDHWSQWGVSPFNSLVHYYLTCKAENKIFKSATAILGVTPQLIDVFKKNHKVVDPSKFHLVTNGFEGNASEIEEIYVDSIENKNLFIIGYVGSFYYSPEAHKNNFTAWWKRKKLHHKLHYTPQKEDWKYRSPYYFLRTLRALFNKYPEYQTMVRFDFIGNKPQWLNEMLVEFNLENNFFNHGFLPQNEAIKLQHSFDAFLATSEKVIDGEHYCLPSKLFDFIDKGKPIIGFLTKGVSADFLRSSKLGFICNPDDVEESVLKLKIIIEGSYKLIPDREYLKKFERRELTHKLAGLIKECIDKN